jgi:multidrug efflux pump subunit AcrA (membrane-fusion protein)
MSAPFAGTVAARYADRGALIPKGTPIVRLIAQGELRVRFALPEERATALAVGDRLRIAAAGLELHGTVEKVAPEIDAASRMVYAEATLDLAVAERERVRSGQVARVFAARAESARR